MKGRRVGRTLLAALPLALAVQGTPLAGTPDHPAAIANLAITTRAVILALPPEQRAPEDSMLLRGPIERLLALSIDQKPAPMAVISRSGEARFESRRRSVETPDSFKSYAGQIRHWWHRDGARDRVKPLIPADVFDRADNAVEAYSDESMEGAIRLVSSRLDRYEVKYGPGSPKLNFVEVWLNAALQGTGLFRPNHYGPSPNEFLISYCTAWVTVADDQATAVSTLELGWRRYNLDWRAGEGGGWSRLLRPRYVSVGLVAAESRDGALRWPLDSVAAKETRLGPFLTMGDLKVGYLFGHENRLLVSRQIQFLPNLF